MIMDSKSTFRRVNNILSEFLKHVFLITAIFNMLEAVHSFVLLCLY